MKKEVIRKTAIVSIVFALFLLLVMKDYLFQTPFIMKKGVSWFIFLFANSYYFYVNYKRYAFEEDLQEYVTSYQLTVEQLSQLTGYSIHSFFKTKNGKIKMMTKNKKEREAVMKKLTTFYGPSSIQKSKRNL